MLLSVGKVEVNTGFVYRMRDVLIIKVLCVGRSVHIIHLMSFYHNSSQLTSFHLIQMCSDNKLGRFTAHDLVHRGCDQSQRTQIS